MPTGLGIDLGSETVKIVQVRTSGTAVSVTAALKIPRPEKHFLGPEAENLLPFVPEQLGAELKRAGLRRAGAVGVSGREFTLKYLATPPMPPEKLKLFLDMELGEKLGGASSPAGLKVTYDYRPLPVTGGARGDVVLMAGICKNEYLYAMNAALQANGVTARHITPACFGLVNTYLRTQKVNPAEVVVLLDVGHELLEIAILEGENLYFARSTPGGGKKLTAALDKLLRLGSARAAEFKHARVRLYPEGAPLPGKQ